ncbi:MAG: NPCBM/NEW2 domain-containing protein [Planctomycetota bacterium]|nr:NPCBM/NEW2 domain-containing protein [Planctomycetota bacterium]
MPVSRWAKAVLVLFAAGCLFAPSTRAAQPVADELAQRDRWVKEHFSPQATGVIAGAAPSAADARMMVWTNYGEVFRNKLPDKPLQIADQKFEHGVYCHAPSRLQVHLPSPGKSFSAVVGILTNPNSQGGSVVFTVTTADKQAYASPVMHRGERGVSAEVDLVGARDFYISVSSSGDGISSDQAVWGNATVKLADGGELRLGDLRLEDPLTRQRRAGGAPFSFFYDGRSSDEFLSSWKFEETRDASAAGKVTRVRTSTDPKTGLAVRCTVVEYTDFPTVEWTLSFKNTGERDTPILAGILPLDARLERSEAGEFLLHHFTGSPCTPNDYEPFETALGPKAGKRIATAGGRPTNTDMPYFNIETGGGGVIAVISWAGQWATQFTRDEGRGLRITGGQESTSFRLHAGEEVRGPIAVLQFYRGDWFGAQNVWRSWMMRHNVPRRNGQTLKPFLFVCNGNYYDGLMTNAATELQFLSRYFEEEIRPDYWNQDAGWYPCDGAGWPKVGTWEVDKKRWPKGLRQVSDWLKERGTKTITWFEPERVAAGTWLADNHPEWIFGGRGGGLVNIGIPECRKWITDRVDQVITQEGIDFYRQDFNIDPLYYWRGNDADDRQGITEIRHVEGYFAYWDELIRRHPALWIDTCASGGRRNDLETLRRAVPILRSDWTPDPSNGADPMDQQNHMYGIAFWMPYNGTGYMSIDKYLARSVMTTIHGIGVDTRKKDLNYELLRKLYREWRLISPCYLGDYYPLTPYRKTADAWAAWQFDLPDAGQGLVQAFRRKNCAEPSLTVKLRGLVADARYELKDLDTNQAKEVRGSELMDPGLTVTAPERQTALVLTYRRISDAKQ